MSWQNGEYQPKQKRADEKKTLLIDAALKLFSEKGYHQVNAKHIASEAGVATGTFYRCFRDKKAVFMAVCHRSDQEIGGRIFEIGEQMRAEGKSEADIMTALIRYAITSHRQNKAFHREVLAMQITEKDVAAWTRQREARHLQKLKTFIFAKKECYSAADLEAAVELIYYLIEEVAHRTILFDSQCGEERLIDALNQMIRCYLFS